jgi:hypothetical protein
LGALLAFLGNGYGNERLGREPVVGIPIEPGFIPLGGPYREISYLYFALPESASRNRKSGQISIIYT